MFANVTYDDILLKDELDVLAAEHENFTVQYTLDKASLQASKEGHRVDDCY